MRASAGGEGALLPPGWRPEREWSAKPAGRRRLGPPVIGTSGGIVLGDGTEIHLRPLVPADRELLADAFAHLSPRSRYRRFLAPMPRLSSSLLTFLTELDQVDHFAWAAVAKEEDGAQVGVGTSRFVRLRDPAAADVAVTVIDAYQGRGIGGLLLDALALRALEQGITRFEGVVLVENLPSRAMLARAGARFEPDGGDVLRYVLDLPSRARELTDSPVQTVLRRYPSKAAGVGPAA